MLKNLKNGEVVGHITITEPRQERVNSEYAAWYTLLELEPGTYPVRAVELFGSFGKFALQAEVPAVVVEDYWQAHFGGMPIGKPYDRKKNAGKKSKFRVDSYSTEGLYLKAFCDKWNFVPAEGRSDG